MKVGLRDQVRVELIVGFIIEKSAWLKKDIVKYVVLKFLKKI